MKIKLILILILTGCATKQPIKKVIKVKKLNRIERKLKCIDRYLDKDQLLLEVSQVCESIFKR